MLFLDVPGSSTTPHPAQARDFAASEGCCLPTKQTVSARGSSVIGAPSPGPPMPLSPLRRTPRGAPRKTRCQNKSLLLSRRALSSPTTCRFIPAHLHPWQSPLSVPGKIIVTPRLMPPAGGAVDAVRAPFPTSGLAPRRSPLAGPRACQPESRTRIALCSRTWL